MPLTQADFVPINVGGTIGTANSGSYHVAPIADVLALRDATFAEFEAKTADRLLSTTTLTTLYHIDTTNSIIGWGVGSNPSGASSTGFGFSALEGNSGLRNVGMGRLALANCTTADNTGFGHAAGRDQTGFNFAGFGDLAGRLNTGNNVSALGSGAGFSNTGDNGTFIGEGSGASNTFDDVVTIGRGSLANASKQVTLGASGSVDQVRSFGIYTGSYGLTSALPAVGSSTQGSMVVTTDNGHVVSDATNWRIYDGTIVG